MLLALWPAVKTPFTPSSAVSLNTKAAMTNPLKQKKTRIAVNILFIHIVPLKDKFNIYNSSNSFNNEWGISEPKKWKSRDPCWDGYVTDARRNSCMKSKMMGEVLIAQQHYLPRERKGLLQHTVDIKASQH